MTIQEMLAKMNPQMLSQGLQKITANMTPEQLKQAENAIKSMSGGVSGEKLKALTAEQLIAELRKNPDTIKQLSQNGELISKLNSIINPQK